MSKLNGAALLAALLSLTTAAAQPSTAPTAPFDGRWRGIGAEVAPWWPSATHAHTENRLARSGLVFRDGVFKGLAPLGCSQPSYTVVSLPPEGLFQGGLAGRDAADDADRMGFPDGDVPTLRVDCQNATFDFHLAGESTLKFALDNVIYTFERAPPIDSGMNEDDFLAPR
jgi:hypothetical protein